MPSSGSTAPGPSSRAVSSTCIAPGSCVVTYRSPGRYSASSSSVTWRGGHHQGETWGVGSAQLN
eukprot:scaffold40173_cov60-Phaeocystis_antarctica.AAC.1